MNSFTLTNRLLDYLRRKGDWVSKGELQRLVSEYTTYTPENAGRRLRELENAGLIKVEYRKNHAWYKATSPARVERFRREDGQIVEVPVY